SASKFALRALTDALREEERGKVRVSSVHPGRVDTDMQVDLQAQMGRRYVAAEHLRPESVAEAVALAVYASPEAMVEQVSIRPVFKA
ncbi:MAG TPA: SDR family NAD(P)-dependent oxidoreductase, partial [Candidatus Luteococcus avicola]|nr:SDR family NAD(P)-dependent oxidoreductase [Candidatus Luteococcus avicola]